MFLLLNKNPYMSPEEVVTGGPIESKELTVDEIINALGTGDSKEISDDTLKDNTNKGEESHTEKEEEVKEEKEKGKETKEEEVDELAELEEELKVPTDDDLELKVPVQRRQLVKDYPDIFKKHPGLESTIYRERAYTELLPTINDAKEALASLQTLERFEADLKQGKTVDIMKAVMADDPQGFAKLADNYMENLAQVDERAYHHVLGNITKDIVTAMIDFGRSKVDDKGEGEGKAVLDAASTLYQFMFNSTKWEGKKKLSIDAVVDSTVSAEKKKLEDERREFEESKKNEHTTKLMSSIDNQIKGTIEKSIDPKDQMSSFVKSKATEEVLSKASKLLKSDNRFQQIVKQLTDKAGKEKFSDEALNRIRSAYFTKYKAILIPIIKAVRSEALKGVTSRTKKDEETNDTTERANRDSAVRNNSSNNSNSKKPLPGESTLDFLMRKK